MGKRAPRLLAIAAVLSPVLGAAQTTPAVTVTDPEIGIQECQTPSTGFTITWNATVTGTPATGDTFQVWATTQTSCPTALPTTQAGTGQFGTLPFSFSNSGSLNKTVGDLVNAISVTSCNDGIDHPYFVCVYLVQASTNTILGTAFGSATVGGTTFKLQLAVPPTPENVNVSPANSALLVSFTPGTTGGQATQNITYQAQALTQGTNNVVSSSGKTTSTSGIRVGGLQNGVTYDVVVIAYSSAGNPSAASATASGTPKDFLDFWQQYQAAGGREQGGCGTGGSGIPSLLALALAALARRRP